MPVLPIANDEQNERNDDEQVAANDDDDEARRRQPHRKHSEICQASIQKKLSISYQVYLTVFTAYCNSNLNIADYKFHYSGDSTKCLKCRKYITRKNLK